MIEEEISIKLIKYNENIKEAVLQSKTASFVIE